MAYTIGIDARKLDDFGIGTYIRNLVLHLGALDRENRYVLFVGAHSQGRMADLPDNFRLVVERSKVYSVRELLALSWKLFRLRLDLYHATHYVLPTVVPCRAVVTIHDIIHLLYPQFLPHPLAFLYAQRMIRRSLVRGDRIIADSQNTRSDLMEYFDIDGRKIRVVYPGVADRFRARLEAAELDRRLQNLGIERPYVLFVGNPKPHKNLDNVVQAFARAVKAGDVPDSLVCVGDRGATQFKIRQRAEQLGISDRLRLLGHVADEELPAIYQGARLFLYPTLYEGFGLPVVEAMASGTPVVTSDTSALKEVADGFAELVNPLDVPAMAAAIRRVLADEKRRRTLSRRGLRRAEDFRWERTAELTLEVYTRAIHSPSGGGFPWLGAGP